MKASIFSAGSRTIKRQIKNLKRSFKLIWMASPYYTTAWIALLLIQGVLPGLLVYLTKLLVDSLAAAINSHGNREKISNAIFFAVLTALATLFSEMFQSLLDMVRTAQADIIQDHVKNLIHDKSSVIDIKDFESPEYQDQLEQVTSDGASRPLSLLESLGGVIQSLVTLLVMAGLLVQYNIWLPAMLFLSTLPAFIIIIRYDRKYHQWWKQTTSERRWIQYFDTMMTHHKAITEVRIFNLNPHFQTSYQNLRKKLRIEKLSQMRKLNTAKLLSTILSLFLLGAVIAWMGWRAFYGGLTLGDLALFYQAFNRGQGLMKTLFGSLGEMIKNSLFIENLFEFLDHEATIKDPENPVAPPSVLKEGIRFKNVTFCYPNSSKPVFENFSIFIPAGKSLAIVGENGSGKTTLFKLICRFYDPQSGSIEFDGVDIRNFRVRDLLRLITITFQLPLNYHAKVNESIGMGDLQAVQNETEIIESAKSAGAHDFISRLSEQYNTMLGNVHVKGAELSGGEWQRLALARSYFRKAPIVLLDEPTSFMDSWAENDWFKRFRNLTADRTAIIITHRFTIAMRADLIFVMDKGQIVEIGTHHELLARNVLYAKSWNAQMKAAATFNEAGKSLN